MYSWEKDGKLCTCSKYVWADKPPTAAKGRGCSADLRKCWDLLGAGTDSREKKSSWSLNWLQDRREYGWSFRVFTYLQLKVAFLHKRWCKLLLFRVSTGGSFWRCSAETISLSMLFFGPNIYKQKHGLKQQYRLVQYAGVRFFKFCFLSSSHVPGVSLLSQIIPFL